MTLIALQGISLRSHYILFFIQFSYRTPISSVIRNYQDDVHAARRTFFFIYRYLEKPYISPVFSHQSYDYLFLKVYLLFNYLKLLSAAYRRSSKDFHYRTVMLFRYSLEYLCKLFSIMFNIIKFRTADDYWFSFEQFLMKLGLQKQCSLQQSTVWIIEKWRLRSNRFNCTGHCLSSEDCFVFFLRRFFASGFTSLSAEPGQPQGRSWLFLLMDYRIFLF